MHADPFPGAGDDQADHGPERRGRKGLEKDEDKQDERQGREAAEPEQEFADA